mmetsp:Transcript_5467/g.8494  ORF Transcript_5467/g.8494 Transcript_5467/m.8494 type:complete len:304 (-) Transcript_5467:325-1236(-)|eukprot:CAMPEP_0184649734 /NCGR_PEP_ID=MMETSP0308-20130426/7139_1 /TAXON_ID=38269 /ORGANISM="Gloeochaete witrockiana, Strain SAG 46.84" /LENGTH=303 /DNA_ID=CAMNT_0027082673 /DNA_START=189 /DNA_END=1100 /DNA_ORIENTATION=-
MSSINWNGLLSWSTKYHDGTAPSTSGEISAERKKFFSDALAAAGMNAEDPVNRLRSGIEKINQNDKATIVEGLELMNDCSDYSDCVQNLDVMNGVRPLVALCQNPDKDIAVGALSVLSLYLGNNMPIQQAACREGAMEILVTRCKDEDSDITLKSMSALGQLVRGVDDIERGFVNNQGVSFVASILSQTSDPRLEQKCMSLIGHFLHLNADELKASLPVSAYLGPVGQGLAKVYSVPDSPGSIDYWETAARVLELYVDVGGSVAGIPFADRIARISSSPDIDDLKVELEQLQRVQQKSSAAQF